jgi:ligand-binding SRPBCC domain-containing protein
VVSYILQREQWFPPPIKEVFAFFADARNLEVITPPWLNFRILTADPIAMGAGTFIEYQIRWHGIPMRWMTEIRSWDPPNGFVDVQLRGPYRHWEHTHTFQASEGGTLMRDVVNYVLPFGYLGQLAQAWFVKGDLETIFDYRATKVSETMKKACNHA